MPVSPYYLQRMAADRQRMAEIEARQAAAREQAMQAAVFGGRHPQAGSQAPQSLAGLYEPAMSMGSGLAGMVPAGWSGLGALAGSLAGGNSPGQAMENAAGAVGDYQQRATYAPRTPQGQANLGGTADALGVLGMPSQWVGDRTNEILGPGAATFAEQALDPTNLLPWGKAAGLAAGAIGATKAARRGGGATADALEAAAEAVNKKLGDNQGLPGTQPPDPNILRNTRFRGGRDRVMFPGIYANPKALVGDVQVAPESPMLPRLFDTTRAELSQEALTNLSGVDRNWRPAGEKGGNRVNVTGHRVATPSNARRLGNIIEATRTERPDLFEGMTGWYETDPLYQRFLAALGPEEAKRRFLQFHGATSLSSPGSDVVTELKRGTAADYLTEQGRLDEYVKWGGNPGKREMLPAPPGANFPGPVDPWRFDPPGLERVPGHAYHSTSQAPVIDRFVSSGFEDLGNASKVPAYYQGALPRGLGKQMNFGAGDAHFARAVGLPDVRTAATKAASATGPEMKVLADWLDREVGGPQGLQGVTTQPVLWGALGPQTGVQTAVGQPKLEILADLIGQTAQRTGQSPEKVLDLLIRTGYPLGQARPDLLAMIGAGSAAGLAAAPLFMNQGGGEEQ